MKILVPFSVLAVLFAMLTSTTGCTKKADRVVVEQPQQPPDYKNRRITADKHLPAAAANVQLFNNYWTYFELEVGGKTRKFLMHHSLPKDDWQGRESLVELRD